MTLFQSISEISPKTKVILNSTSNNFINTGLIMDNNQVYFFNYTIPGQKKNVIIKYYFKP
ncbi:expressed protein [Dictyostelium purpureum]|uniref:Expressed protein n=1 Tax=Dictyostelium purpureum TaxID=5786 RepID=F0ZMG0_DICPU|nr:uncharacterized protein DICPUDRAFT_94691 [Dictyostelium purpureum]EGC34861.1 expressed protein [Dictyostelium purpureum]|eukprot:XP_003288615.1 expressed protein [Dictyostelium purpureum]